MSVLRTDQCTVKSDNSLPSQPIVGRLAPSPTGRLHLGHARSFLLAWWHARSRGGRIVLRLEDLDAERAKPGMIEATLDDLRWLGVDWDGEPYVQSSGVTAIDAAAESLLTRGLAYPCTCTRKEILSAMSAPHGERHEHNLSRDLPWQVLNSRRRRTRRRSACGAALHRSRSRRAHRRRRSGCKRIRRSN